MSWFGWGTRSVKQPSSLGIRNRPVYSPGTEIGEDKYNLLPNDEKASWLFSRSESVQTGWNEYETINYYTKYSSPQAAAEALARKRSALAQAKAAKDASDAEWVAKKAAAAETAKAEAKAAAEWAEKHPAKPERALPWEKADDKVEPYVSPQADEDYASLTVDEHKRLISLVKYNERFPERLNKDPNENYDARLFYIVERDEQPLKRYSINTLIQTFNNNGIDGRMLGEIFEGAIRFMRMEKDLLELKALEELENNIKDEMDERILSQTPFPDLLPKLEDIRKRKETLVKKIPVANSRPVVEPRKRRASFGGGRMRKISRKGIMAKLSCSRCTRSCRTMGSMMKHLKTAHGMTKTAARACCKRAMKAATRKAKGSRKARKGSRRTRRR